MPTEALRSRKSNFPKKDLWLTGSRGSEAREVGANLDSTRRGGGSGSLSGEAFVETEGAGVADLLTASRTNNGKQPLIYYIWVTVARRPVQEGRAPGLPPPTHPLPALREGSGPAPPISDEEIEVKIWAGRPEF